MTLTYETYTAYFTVGNVSSCGAALRELNANETVDCSLVLDRGRVTILLQDCDAISCVASEVCIFNLIDSNIRVMLDNIVSNFSIFSRNAKLSTFDLNPAVSNRSLVLLFCSAGGYGASKSVDGFGS